MTLHNRILSAGYGHLWEDYNLRYSGILHMVKPQVLTRPTVLTPESVEPLAGPFSYYRLTVAQHRELLNVMFGEDTYA